MQWRSLLVNLGKFLVCVATFMLGLMLGSTLATTLHLQPPSLPEGFDAESAGLYLMLESPLWILVLVGLGCFLAGGFVARVLILAWLSWVANVLNTQIEAFVFGSVAAGFWFSLVTFALPCLLAAAAMAWLFPPPSKVSFADAARAFFRRYSAWNWTWRLGLAAVIFVPIYYFFGLLVTPFTIDYYRQGLYGLQLPPLSQLLVILFIRSVLFFLACLPVLVAWQNSGWKLVLFLGLALFYFVGFQALLIANWMPWGLRLPHLIEIMAGEFVYAEALAVLLGVAGQKVSAIRMVAARPTV